MRYFNTEGLCNPNKHYMVDITERLIFKVDMSLSETGIKGMLNDYEKDHNTGMETEHIAKVIHDYTNGYPYLVSKICQIIDQKSFSSDDTTKTDETDKGENAAEKIYESFA